MKKQSGNALWFILLAIFLLGGLTVLLSRTGSNTEETGSTERLTIAATEVTRYGAGLAAAIQAMIVRGCSENQLSFWHDSNGDGVENASDDYYNPQSPADKSCHIFHAAGGGQTYQDISTKIAPGLTMRFGTAIQGRVIRNIGTDTKTDLYLFISGTKGKMDVFCERMNAISGIAKTGTAPAGTFDPATANLTVVAAGMFTGTFYSPVVTYADIPVLYNKKSFCVGQTIATTNYGYVLLAR